MSDLNELPLFAECKLSRAAHHIADLKSSIRLFFQDRPFKLVRRYDPESGELSLSIKKEKQIPKEISLIIGDAIHNLRATLDMTYFTVIRPYVKTDKNIQFPIYNNNNKNSVLGLRSANLAPKAIKNAIDACEPEPGGIYSLYELNAMDVIDKHRVIILIANVTRINPGLINIIFPELGVNFAGGGEFRFFGGQDDLYDSVFTVCLSPVHPIARSGAFEEEVKLSSGFGLSFFGDDPVRGDVIEALDGLYSKVREACTMIWRAAKASSS